MKKTFVFSLVFAVLVTYCCGKLHIIEASDDDDDDDIFGSDEEVFVPRADPFDPDDISTFFRKQFEEGSEDEEEEEIDYVSLIKNLFSLGGEFIRLAKKKHHKTQFESLNYGLHVLWDRALTQMDLFSHDDDDIDYETACSICQNSTLDMMDVCVKRLGSLTCVDTFIRSSKSCFTCSRAMQKKLFCGGNLLDLSNVKGLEECDEDALTDREECNEEKDLGQRVDCMIEDVVQVILCKAEYAITVYQNSFCQKCRN